MSRNIAQIMRDDAKRRNARRAAEEADIAAILSKYRTPEGIDPYHFSRSITGQPKDRHRQIRASENCWNRGMSKSRTVGVADASNPTPYASVRVIHNGTTEIVPASKYRAARNHSKRAPIMDQIDLQNRRDQQHHVTAAEMAAIGNVE